MLKYPKEKVQSEEIAPFLNSLHNYLKYIKIMSWLPVTVDHQRSYIMPVIPITYTGFSGKKTVSGLPQNSVPGSVRILSTGIGNLSNRIPRSLRRSAELMGVFVV
jgi:hypothetical protein